MLQILQHLLKLFLFYVVQDCSVNKIDKEYQKIFGASLIESSLK